MVRSRFSQNKQTGNKPDSTLVWGMATIQWGNDVARPQPPAAATVTP
jgi:hypothetical protein